MRHANLAVKFLLELAALVSVGVAGHHAWGWPGAVFAPLAVACLWGSFAAPKAPRRWPTAPRIVLELGVFAASFAALAWSGHTWIALALAGVTLLNAIGLTLWRQWEH